MDFEPGTLLAGKYRVERVIGRGGMGVVLAVRHEKLEQRMALKLILPDARAHDEAAARFLREARAAARIQSEHVARVFDVGELDSGEPYMAMEYLEGSDVASLIATRGTLEPQQAVDYLLQACEALAEAHARGIVHRDLKPGNLFLVERVGGDTTIKLLDFGISKVAPAAESRGDGVTTNTSSLMGSPLYMSPEQMLSSRTVDARTDIWALGVVLYEMLSGNMPFMAETMPEICALVMQSPPVPLERHKPELPGGLVRVVMRCLEKRPDDRFADVAELAKALAPHGSALSNVSAGRIQRVLGSVAESAGAPALARNAGPPREASTRASWSDTRPPLLAGRRRLLWVVLPLAALATGAGLFLASENRRAPIAAPSAPEPLGHSVSGAPSLSAALPETATHTPEPAVMPTAPVPTVRGAAPTPEARPSSQANPSRVSGAARRRNSTSAPAPSTGAGPGLGTPGARSRR
jgi:eukaryotic-like serine/threonine-protein kinase